jgi:hypothetical protein
VGVPRFAYVYILVVVKMALDGRAKTYLHPDRGGRDGANAPSA